MTLSKSAEIQLGLIGDNIAASKAKRLHETAGRLTGLDVAYDRLVPREIGAEFDGVFDMARDAGFRGLNITYPYKERVTQRVSVADPLVRSIGAVNTVVFEEDGPKGYNTDYTGFIAAFKNAMGDVPAGTVCLIGTGGVGKAVAFGLIALGADVIRCVDLDAQKAEALAEALRAAGSDTKIETFTDAKEAANGADGLINCTPVGMVGYGGTPLPAESMQGATWAFDAVYTPVDTQFLTDAAAAGLTVISGYALFLGQGFDAWAYFTGVPLDTAALTAALQEEDA